MTVLLITLLSLALVVYTTMGIVGAIHTNRAALPVVGAVFVMLLIFGAFW